MTTLQRIERASSRQDGFRRSWYRFSKNRLSVVGLVTVGIVVLLAIFAPYIAPYPKDAGAVVNFRHANEPPNWSHLFGTDDVGRDVLSRTIFGFRYSLMMGAVVLSIATPVGVVLGLLAGYMKGRWLDSVIMRITDIFLALPPLIMALLINAVLGPSLINAMIAMTIMWWPWYCRLVYGQVAVLRNETYVLAAEMGGARRPHLLLKEILPNCISSVLTKMTLDMAIAILLGASLSFVGLGAQPPTPDLGTMVASGSNFLPDFWWIAIFPVMAIIFTVLGFNLLGDGLRDFFAVEEQELDKQ